MAKWTAQEFLNAWEVEHSKLDAKWHEEFLTHPITLKILAFESTEIMNVLNKKRLVEILVDLEDEKARRERKAVGTYSEKMELMGSLSSAGSWVSEFEQRKRYPKSGDGDTDY